MPRQDISPDLLQIAPLMLRIRLSFEDSLLRLVSAIQCNTRSVSVRIHILLLVSLSWLVSSLQNHVQINLLRLQWTIQTGTIECAAWTHTKLIVKVVAFPMAGKKTFRGYLMGRGRRQKAKYHDISKAIRVSPHFSFLSRLLWDRGAHEYVDGR